MPSSIVRKSIWGIIVVAAIVVLVVAALPWIASTRLVRDRIALEMSALSGYRVELASAPDVHIWPTFRAVLNDVSLSDWDDPERWSGQTRDAKRYEDTSFEAAFREPDQLLVCKSLIAAGFDPITVLIPSGALRRDAQGENFVWVVTDGRVRRQRIEAAGEVGGKLRVTTGLKGGEAVVVTGDPAREGQRVAVEG